jgi:hypothetical protein
VQFEFAGRLNLADGRYLARDGGDDDKQSVLVVETSGALPAPRRRRRRPQEASRDIAPTQLPIVRATVVRAWEPLDSPQEAGDWLERMLEAESAVETLIAEGIALFNKALFAQATTAADSLSREVSVEQSVATRIGYGNGEEVAAGRFSAARAIDARAYTSRRQRREAELRPQERVAAVLRGQEKIDACEILLLRARADLNGGRLREAALQLRVGLEALLVELSHALVDPGHEEDMAQLEARRHEVGEAANAALRGELDAASERNVGELLEISERVLRRRRVLRG